MTISLICENLGFYSNDLNNELLNNKNLFSCFITRFCKTCLTLITSIIEQGQELSCNFLFNKSIKKLCSFTLTTSFKNQNSHKRKCLTQIRQKKR